LTERGTTRLKDVETLKTIMLNSHLLTCWRFQYSTSIHTFSQTYIKSHVTAKQKH